MTPGVWTLLNTPKFRVLCLLRSFSSQDTSDVLCMLRYFSSYDTFDCRTLQFDFFFRGNAKLAFFYGCLGRI